MSRKWPNFVGDLEAPTTATLVGSKKKLIADVREGSGIIIILTLAMLNVVLFSLSFKHQMWLSRFAQI